MSAHPPRLEALLADPRAWLGKLRLLRRAEDSLYQWRSLQRRWRIRRHGQSVARRGQGFNACPELMVAMQCFNKDFLLQRALQPFLQGRLQHLLVFADGCSDRTASRAHRLLCGPDHLVIAANDRHEVANNRLALTIAELQGCAFLLLLQDDDLYPPDLAWLHEGLALLAQHPRLLVLGFNVGLDFLSFSEAPSTYPLTPLRSRADVHPQAVGIDDAFLAIRHGLPPHPPGLRFRFCQAVYRAPLLIRVTPFLREVGIDPRFAPFQDDDTHFCLKAWSQGWQCGLLSGVPIRRNVGIGGMRLMGHIGRQRAAHTLRNIRLVHQEFGEQVNSAALQAQVDAANRAIGLAL